MGRAVRPSRRKQVTNLEVEPKFFPEFTAHGISRWFVGFGHTTGQVPIRLVPRINEQNAPMCVTQDHIRAHPLTGLLSIAFGKIGVPCFGVTFVQRVF
jgi:hypothetical protein